MSGVRYGIPITLLPEDFNPLMEVVPDSLRDTTNEEGRFRFRVSEGVYTLSARVAVDTFVYRGDLATEDSLYVEDSVRAGGAIQLSIPDSIAELLVSCYVRGTPFTWPVSSGGSVLLKNVPAGTVSIRCYSSSAGEIEELARDGIVVTPNRTTPVR